MKIHIVFSFHATLIFSLNECPGLCLHRPGHSLGEKVPNYYMVQKAIKVQRAKGQKSNPKEQNIQNSKSKNHHHHQGISKTINLGIIRPP